MVKYFVKYSSGINTDYHKTDTVILKFGSDFDITDVKNAVLELCNRNISFHLKLSLSDVEIIQMNKL